MIRTTLATLIVVLIGAHAADWDYAQNGADWSGVCASGVQQSPINLDTVNTEPLEFGIAFSESSTPVFGAVVNNGHTMVYVPNTVGAVTITNPMNGDAEYTLAQFHCHWDATAETTRLGSEHTMDSAPYPLECHFVHYRTSYGSLGGAIGNSDGLMVVGQFYEIDDAATNAELDKFLDAAAQVVAKGAGYNLTEALAITPLVTSDPDVYHYRGSLTTPTCNEVVSWFVYRTPMGVRLSQLQKLWALEKGVSDGTIETNWRFTQPLNGRTVYRNFAIGSSDFYTCSNMPQYWLNVAAAFGVDPCRIGYDTNEGQWYIDGEPSCVAWGWHDVPCNPDYFCAGLDGTSGGYGAQQMGTLAEMIAGNSMQHSMCPDCPSTLGPEYVDVCIGGSLIPVPRPIDIYDPDNFTFELPGSVAIHEEGTWIACDCSEIHIGHPVPSGSYWHSMAELAGLDGELVTHYDGVWYYDEKFSCVGMGYAGDVCDGSVYHCAGSNGTTFGYGSQQMAALKSASLLETGRHVDCLLPSHPIPLP